MRSTESAIIISYPTSVSRIIKLLLLNIKHWIRKYIILFSTDSRVFGHFKKKFPCQFPHLDKLQDIGFIPWVESQSDYQKFNIQFLVSNNLLYSVAIFWAEADRIQVISIKCSWTKVSLIFPYCVCINYSRRLLSTSNSVYIIYMAICVPKYIITAYLPKSSTVWSCTAHAL